MLEQKKHSLIVEGSLFVQVLHGSKTELYLK